MTEQTIGILHPGQMGVSIAASARNSGHVVLWASDGRSENTCARAEENHLEDVGTVPELCAKSEVVVCVCPPDAAEQVASDVVASGFRGLYVDANAISSNRAVRIGEAMQNAGAEFVDGSIIGPPAWEPDTTWLYLSGYEARAVADLFAAGPVQAVVIGDAPGQASALKMCYAANTKGSTALLTAILGVADSLGVLEALQEQWRIEGSGLDESAIRRARTVTAKAWRFAGEMDEIASTFEGAGFPGGFHRAAGDIYRRLAAFKDASETPALEDVLDAMESRATESGN